MKRPSPPSPVQDIPLLANLPASYGLTQLTLMEVDPYWVFAYWEVAEEDMQKARKKMGRSGRDAKMALRVHDVTNRDGAAKSAEEVPFQFDIELTPQANSWYINLWSPHRLLYAELVLVGAKGKADALARSNRIETPPVHPAPFGEERWGRVRTRPLRHRSSPGEPLPGARVSSATFQTEVGPKSYHLRQFSVELGTLWMGIGPGPSWVTVAAHYRASNLSVFVPVPMDAARSPGRALPHKATLAALVGRPAPVVSPGGSHTICHDGSWCPAWPFDHSDPLVLDGVLAVTVRKR